MGHSSRLSLSEWTRLAERSNCPLLCGPSPVFTLSRSWSRHGAWVSCLHPRWWACVVSNTTAPALENIILCQYSSRANDNWVVCWAGWIAFVGKGYTAIQPCSYLVPQLHGRTASNLTLVWFISGLRKYRRHILDCSQTNLCQGVTVVCPRLVAFVWVLGGGWI